MNSQNINYAALISQDKYKFEEIVNFIENKVINADGLTLAEVFQALVKMLNDDLELVKRVLAYTNVMVKHGMKVAKESQLNRADVRRALESKENMLNRQDFIKKSPLPPAIKSIKKKGRGF
ncbi:MAG: hypothetical protein ACR5KV_01590 [Wolbachia sp.]